MNAAQSNRARIAQRAAENPAPSTVLRRSTVGTNLGLRPTTVLTPIGREKRTKATRLTATQRNSEGRRSEWNASPYYFTDPKWDRTVTR